MNLHQQRKSFTESSAALRRARNLYVALNYSALLVHEEEPEARNRILDRMAHRMISGGLYVLPKAYQDGRPTAASRKDVRHAIGRKLCKLWRIKNPELEKKYVSNWMWSHFMQEFGFTPGAQHAWFVPKRSEARTA